MALAIAPLERALPTGHRGPGVEIVVPVAMVAKGQIHDNDLTKATS